MNIDIKSELRSIILNTKSIQGTYNTKHTNSKYDLNIIIDEILYFIRSGVSWRMLRGPINYKTLHWHYSRFVKCEVFTKLFNRIKRSFLKHYTKVGYAVSFYIDSTIIYNKGGINKIGRNKLTTTVKRATKISLLTDKNGFPLSVLFMKGNQHDNTVFDKHIRDIELNFTNITIIADKAYSSARNYESLNKKNIQHIIPPRKNMKIYAKYSYDKRVYSQRIRIEHIFARLKIYKRINLRYDKFLRNYKGFVLLALSIIALRCC